MPRLHAVLIAAAAVSPSAQPLPSGGGGGGGGGGWGGGGGGGRGGSSSSSSSITCAPNCQSCRREWECDVCNVGYVLTADRRCAPCSRNCENCDDSGAGHCDKCLPRFVLQYGECEACGPHCNLCDDAGPGRCDRCDDGYLVWGDKACEACASHCRTCHHPGEGGCDVCRWLYKLQPEGTCALDKAMVLLLTVVVGFLLAVVGAACARTGGGSHISVGGSQIPRPLSHGDYLSAGLLQDATPAGETVARGEVRELPSGVWRGYYTFSGMRHNVCEFTLTFPAGSGLVTGTGVDDVGQYHITGAHRGLRLAFTKKYVARSLNATGVISYGNKGHEVEYRGEQAGSTLGEGFRGVWTIHSREGDYTGQFHLWPCMEGFADNAAAGEGDTGQTFQESECVVCYDRAINTRLRPCGHVALCSTCAGRLPYPRKCPLCRAAVTAIDPHAPA